MRWEHRVQADAAAWPEVVALVSRRPASWLRPFLLLAAPDAGHHRAGRRVWLRLGPMDGDPEAPFWWRPYGPDDLFDRFVGQLGLRCDRDQIWIWIDGEPEGGDPLRTDRTLRTLVGLLAHALAGISGPDT